MGITGVFMLAALTAIIANPNIPCKNRVQAQLRLAEMVELTSLLNSAIAERDAAVLFEQTKRQPLINQVSAELSERAAVLETWAKANRDQEFGDRQSLDFPHGTLQFRWGNRSVAELSGWTFKQVLARLAARIDAGLRKLSKLAGPYVRIKAELNKQKILADTSGAAPKLTPAKLRAMGLKIAQEESFTVELLPAGAAKPQLEVA